MFAQALTLAALAGAVAAQSGLKINTPVRRAHHRRHPTAVCPTQSVDPQGSHICKRSLCRRLAKGRDRRLGWKTRNVSHELMLTDTACSYPLWYVNTVENEAARHCTDLS